MIFFNLISPSHSKTPHRHVPAAAVSQQISKHLRRRADGKVSASLFIRHRCHVSSQVLAAQKRRRLWGLISLFPYSLMPPYTVPSWLSAAITRRSENKSRSKWSVQLKGFFRASLLNPLAVRQQNFSKFFSVPSSAEVTFIIARTLALALLHDWDVYQRNVLVFHL